MSEHINTHRLTIGKHTEDVTEAGLANIKKTFGAKFSDYEVTPLQPEKPADVAPKAKTLIPAGDKPAA